MVQLVEVCDFQGGSQPPKEEWADKPTDGYIRMLQIRDFTQDREKKKEYVKLTDQTKICNADDILIARYGASLGKILTGRAGAYNVAMMKTLPNEMVLVKPYFHKFLLSDMFQYHILNLSSRAAQAGFNKNDLKAIQIPLPTLEKQQKIADVLDLAGALIEKRKAQIEKLDLLIKSQFIEMFGDPLIQNPKWDFKRLGDITTVVSGSTPKTNVDKFWDGILKWITPAELSNNTFYVMDSERHITELGAQDLGLKPFPAGTVILSSRAPIGKVAIAGTEMYCNQGFKNLICSESISPIYLFWMLKQKTVYLNSLGRGATFKEISKKIVEDIKISIPPLVLQTQFADFVSQVEAQKSLLQQSLEKLEINYKSLMQKCFRGEIF